MSAGFEMSGRTLHLRVSADAYRLSGFAKVAGALDMSGKNQTGPIILFRVPDLMSDTQAGAHLKNIFDFFFGQTKFHSVRQELEVCLTECQAKFLAVSLSLHF